MLKNETNFKLDDEKPQPMILDDEAPKVLELNIADKKDGTVFYTELATQKHFSTGSVGYYCSGKMTNPHSGGRYQISCNITLIGSKPTK